jgi:hypothetical protein
MHWLTLTQEGSGGSVPRTAAVPAEILLATRAREKY